MSEPILKTPTPKYHEKGDPARYLSGVYTKQIQWTPFVIVGILISLLGAIGISYGTTEIKAYIFGAIIGLIGAAVVFQKPELGAYILIITVFSNASDLLTEHGLPGINKPLIALTVLSILANYLLRTGKFSKFPNITAVEWALFGFYAAIVASTFATPDKSQLLVLIVDITKDILVGITIFITLNTRERWEQGLRIFIIVMTILAGLGIIKTITGTSQTFLGLAQLSAFGQVGEGGELRYGGPIAESNLWGQVLSATLPLILYQLKNAKKDTNKILLGIASFLVLLAAIYTSSRGAMVALTIVIPLIALEMKIRPVNIMAGVLILVALISVLPETYTKRFATLNVFINTQDQYAINQDESFVNRRNEMLAGLAMFQEHPILGVGFGNYSSNYWEYAGRLGLSGSSESAQGQSEKLAHSLYVEILSELGLAGFLTFSLFFYLIFTALLAARKNYEKFVVNSAWASQLTALFFSLITFLISGIFLHGLLFRYIWMLIGFALSGIAINQDLIKTFNINPLRKNRRNHS